MTDYAIAAGERGAWEKTLAANTPDTVTFDYRPGTLEVLHHSGASPLYVRTGGAAATVGGAACYMVNPGTSLQVGNTKSRGDTIVSVVSAATAVYSVGSADD